MRTIIGISCVSILLLFNACKSGDQTVQKSRLKTMYIKSSGEVSVKPDEASITIYLSCTDKNIKRSKECLIEKSDAFNKSILDYGVKPDDILTTSITQSKDYKWVNNSSVFNGYRSAISTHLTIRNLKVLEDLYSDLLENENISMSNLSYSHSNMDSLNTLAYQKALENANNLADQLLSKMDESHKEILRIGNMDFPSESGYDVLIEGNFKMEEVKKTKGNSIQINNGTMYATQMLFVEFKIN